MTAPNLGVWGIDLGQCALKAIRLENIDGQVTATAFDYIEHPKILSQPDADPDQLTREALEQFLSRNQLKGDMVVISVPGQSGLARFVKLPPVEEKKIADIVKFEAKQQIPFPLEEVVWDFQKLGAGIVTDGFAMETEIGLFAMKRDMVNRYLQHFKDVNVDVHIVQMSPLALCNFISYDLLGKESGGEGDEEEKKQCIVALDIGTDNSNLVITDGGKIIWQRPIPLGGNHFTRALTKDMKLTFAKAEHLKRNAVKSPDLKKILSSLKTVLNDFVGEVQRSLGYFTNTHRDAQIQFMVGLGNAFRLPGLQKFLQEKLQLEVRKLQSLERLAGEDVIAAPQFTENILGFGVPYGLALQGLGLPRLQTNLLPYEIRLERLVRAKKPWAAAAAAVILLAAAGLTFGRNIEHQAVDPKNPEIAKAIKDGQSVQQALANFESQYTALKAQLEESEKAILRIGSGVDERYNWRLFYDYVNMALPRPDGQKIAKMTRNDVPAYTRYVTKEAKDAHKKVLAKLHPLKLDEKKAPDAKEQARDDELIKKNLIQINIEGFGCLYFDDLENEYFDKLKEELLPGMSDVEKKKVWSLKDAATKDPTLPKKGWVVEIRGYTQHWDGEVFVANTLLENLANPEGAGNKLSKEMQAKIKDRIAYLWIKQEKVNNPEPGVFKMIGGSLLVDIRSDKGAAAGKGIAPVAPNQPAAAPKPSDKRLTWKPIGEVAGPLLSGGAVAGGGPRAQLFKKPAVPVVPAQGPKEAAPAAAAPPRTEFFILFVWQEPTIEDSQNAIQGQNPVPNPTSNR